MFFLENKNSETTKVDLFIKVTDYCNVDCPFCTYHSTKKECFSMDYLVMILALFFYRKIELNSVIFTGGDPSIFPNEVKEACEYIKELANTPIVINTRNDIFIDSSLVNYVFLSRNDIIDFPVNDMINHYYKSQIYIKCVLQKHFTDTPEKINTFIDHYCNEGIVDFEFDELLKVNDYAKKAYTKFPENPKLKLTQQVKNNGNFENSYLYQNQKYPFPMVYHNNIPYLQKSNKPVILDIDCLKDGITGKEILNVGEICS